MRYGQGLRSGHDKQNGAIVRSRKEGRKPPFEVLFAVWLTMAAIAVFDILGVLATLEVAKEPKQAWVPWLFGFILLLLSVIAASFVQTLKDGDRTMRYYLSFTVPLWGLGFSWGRRLGAGCSSWSRLLLLAHFGCRGLGVSSTKPRMNPLSIPRGHLRLIPREYGGKHFRNPSRP